MEVDLDSSRKELEQTEQDNLILSFRVDELE
jgi:hypothetical protein